MELFGRADVNVRRIAFGVMQARVLEFDWIVPADHALGTPWTDFPAVTYTDPAHPKYNFIGVAIEPARQFKAGQSIRVSCTDVWRNWERLTARLTCGATTPPYIDPGTSKIRIREGVTVESAIQTILDRVSADIPGGINFTLPDVTDTPNPDAPLTVVDQGTFNIFHTYALNDIVTFKNKQYIAVAAVAALAGYPDVNAQWDWYTPYSATPHAPILYVTQDKVGQKIATWLHDILDQTENGIALIDVESGFPALSVYDYTSKDAVTLKVGAFDVINPDATNPLVQSGEIKQSQNNKYEKIIVEGAGIYTRHVAVDLTPVLLGSETLPGSVLMYHFRFYFPETNVVGLFLDNQNVLFDRIFYRFNITRHPSGALDVIETGWQQLLVLSTDESEFLSDGSANSDYGRFCMNWDVPTTPGDTAPVFNLAQTRYTSYDGPLLVTKASDDANLAGAGDFPIHMPMWYKYDSPGFLWIQRPLLLGGYDNIFGDGSTTIVAGDIVHILEAVSHRDYSFRMTDLANAYFKRYCDSVDSSGSLNLIVKDLTASIEIGTAIANFNNARVSNIEFNPDKRILKIQVSDQPIRAFMERHRDYQTQRSALYGNNRNNKQHISDAPLFPDLSLDDLCLIVDPPIVSAGS